MNQRFEDLATETTEDENGDFDILSQDAGGNSEGIAIHHIHPRADDGERWERLPSETEQQFIDRASDAAKRTASGFALRTTFRNRKRKRAARIAS